MARQGTARVLRQFCTSVRNVVSTVLGVPVVLLSVRHLPPYLQAAATDGVAAAFRFKDFGRCARLKSTHDRTELVGLAAHIQPQQPRVMVKIGTKRSTYHTGCRIPPLRQDIRRRAQIEKLRSPCNRLSGSAS